MWKGNSTSRGAQEKTRLSSRLIRVTLFSRSTIRYPAACPTFIALIPRPDLGPARVCKLCLRPAQYMWLCAMVVLTLAISIVVERLAAVHVRWSQQHDAEVPVPDATVNATWINNRGLHLFASQDGTQAVIHDCSEAPQATR